MVPTISTCPEPPTGISLVVVASAAWAVVENVEASKAAVNASCKNIFFFFISASYLHLSQYGTAKLILYSERDVRPSPAYVFPALFLISGKISRGVISAFFKDFIQLDIFNVCPWF